MLHRSLFVLAVGLGVAASSSRAADRPDPEAVRRGEQALLGKSYIPSSWSRDAWDRLGRVGLPGLPPCPPEELRHRYGLHEAPYPNKGLPMGMREGTFLFSTGLTFDCLVCHGGSVAGTSYVGLGNASLDLQAFLDDLGAIDGRHGNSPIRFCNVRGTNEAGATAVYLLGFREPDLKLRKQWLDLGIRDDLCEDVPAWWLLKKKTTMYHTGGGDARSVRSLMQFMLSPLNPPGAFEKAEAEFRDIRAYILSLEPPKYPFPIDAAKAAKGHAVFRANCQRCHGTYGPNWTYPNKVVPIDEIGTDRRRFDGLSEAFGRLYNQSWFAKERTGWLGDDYAGIANPGYQAPPLDGIWATAPYLHNGSVPTVYHLLNSAARPRLFTRSYRTDADAYDPVRLGWKVRELSQPPDEKLPAVERRKVYDTTQPGRGNAGHTYGDRLTEEERLAVIEYLKTL
jgi:mono/diheme cytochrome c family protein